MKKKQLNLTSGPILRTLSELALPIMATSLVQTAYNLTDMAWIGVVGSEAVAAVGAYEQRRHGDGVEHEVFFHGFRDLVARKVRRKGPVRFLFFRKQPLHDEGDALGDERH